MVVTKVTFDKLRIASTTSHLQALCSIIIDECLAIHGLKIIEGPQRSFVAMPTCELTDKCPNCHGKNRLRARYCNDCGGRLNENRAHTQPDGRQHLFSDVLHPINRQGRAMVEEPILEAFAKVCAPRQGRDQQESLSSPDPSEDFGIGLTN